MSTETKEHLITFTDANWDKEVTQKTGLTLVDVWAPWCAPCRMIGPIIEELAEKYSGRINIGKLNADENKKVGQLGVSGIPTLLILRDGEEVDRIVGAVPKAHLVEKLDYYLGTTTAQA